MTNSDRNVGNSSLMTPSAFFSILAMSTTSIAAKPLPRMTTGQPFWIGLSRKCEYKCELLSPRKMSRGVIEDAAVLNFGERLRLVMPNFQSQPEVSDLESLKEQQKRTKIMKTRASL
jgi:hypothetical protein